MNTKLIPNSILALALTASAPMASADGSHWPIRPAIVGSWQVTITPVDCNDGTEFAQFATPVHVTFALGGTAAENTSSPSFQAGQRSSGHGYWEYTGRGTYHSYYEAFVLFDSVDPVPPQRPYVRGTQSFDHSMAVQDKDHWTSDALVTFRNTAGEQIGGGCAKTAAVRMR